ncbi:MAG: molecular chaperone DnaJ [Alphaproteobacteria bacterium]|nr:molecular chaperone DnaJ [Alphaproteobacteria bacterium]
MPRIKLKPGSPEYDDDKPQVKAHTCEMPGCAAEGSHKAPKHRGLNEYYHFCLDHIREYNAAWNFFSGMSEMEIQDHIIDSIYGHRPTRRYDTLGDMAERLREAAWQTYNFTEEKPRQERRFTEDQIQTPEVEALAIMGLEPPITLDVIKRRYKELAKKTPPGS